MAVIFKLSDASALGLHGAMYLALTEGQPVTARRISEAFDISEAHLVKVLQALHRAGLVNGTRGPGGGYQLNRPAEEIPLLDLIEAIEGPLEAQDCMLNHPSCHNRNCILGPLVKNINLQTMKYLKEHTVRDLAATVPGIDALLTKEKKNAIVKSKSTNNKNR